MYYNDPNENYTIPKKKERSVLPAVCAILSVLLVFSLAATAAVTFMYLSNDNNTASSAEVRQEIYEELEKKYQEEFDSLNAKITKLSTTRDSPLVSGNILSEFDGITTPVIAIAEEATPSVVGIRVVIPSSKVQSGFFWYETGDLESTGSGIILTEDGYIATNYHVVSYFDEYENVYIGVILSDGTELSAELIGGDQANDLAVIKADTEGLKLQPATMGVSEDLKVGEIVVAIGNPLGTQFAGTVTMGIVSALDRNISTENTAETLIQTDAAINPGNSGGALFNSSGEVIGITSSKIADKDVEGIGFAIPIDYAKPIIEDIIEYGYVKDRPATGISGQTVSQSMARYYGFPAGVVVSGVDTNSGADLAGIEIYDVITEINGEEIRSMEDIQRINESHKVGDILEVTFFRNGYYYNVNLMLLEDRGR